MSVRSRVLALIVMSALVILGCSPGGSKASKGSHQGRDSDVPSGATPRSTPADAVTALLSAEQRGEHGTSYLLLSAKGRTQYPTEARWARRRGQLPAITGFDVAAGARDTAVASVSHEPALDAFHGLTPAKERETWAVRKVSGGWLVDPDPRFEPVLPDEGKARDAAAAWADAVARCDQPQATSLQAADPLFGTPAEAARLCGSSGAVVVGAVGSLPEGPVSEDIVGQYSTDAFTWARVVPVNAPTTFRVVLAPLGETWKVLGILPKA
jgi:hypothetical protein